VSVFEWADPDEPDEVLLSTVGMSEVQHTVAPGMSSLVDDPRTELLMVARREDVAQLADLLIDLALYPRTHGTFLHWFHDLALGVPVRPASLLSCVFFSLPPVDGTDFSTFQVGGRRIDILWAIPISEAERRLKRERGTEALEDLIESVDLSDLSRASVA
jgi:hypothetical protein